MPPGLGEHPHDTDLPLAPLFRTIARRWNEERVVWAVLRNAESLPTYTRYDIDVLVSPPQLKCCLDILEEVVQETGWRVVGRINKNRYTCVMLRHVVAGQEPFYLPIDFFVSLEFRGSQYACVDTVLSQRIQTERGVWAIPPAVDAAITLLKELYPHRTLKTNSRQRVQANASCDRDTFRLVLANAAGVRGAVALDAAIKNGSWEELPKISQCLRRTPPWCLGWLQSFVANIRHLFRPSLGCVIALAGADGSGKTTLAEGLACRTYKRPFKAIRYVHGNVGVLPRIRDMRARMKCLLGRPAPEATTEEGPLKGMMTPVPAWKSALLAMYYTVDLILSRLLLRRWRGQWMLVVMDRSFFDYYYQLGHRNISHRFLDLLATCIPKPDRLFCVVGDAAAIHARKPELTIEEIEREQTVLRALAQRWPFATVIDGTNGVESMIAQAQGALEQVLFPDTGDEGPLQVYCHRKRAVLAYPRQQGRRALKLFPGMTAKRRLIRNVLSVLATLRLDRLLLNGQVTAPQLNEVLDRVRGLFAGRPVTWLIGWPAQVKRQRWYLFFQAEPGERGMAKVAYGPADVNALRNEVDSIRALAQTNPPFLMPSLLFDGPIGPDAHVAVFAAPEGPVRAVTPQRAHEVAERVIAHLATVPVPSRVCRLMEGTWYTRFQQLSETFVEQYGAAGRLVDVGWAHGDLGPGNMMEDGPGRVMLYDWEYACADAPVLTDAVGFWIATRQKLILDEPSAQWGALRKQFQESPEAHVVYALAYLAGHGNLAATRLLEHVV